MKVPDDVLVLPGPESSWVLFNVQTRDALATNADGLAALRAGKSAKKIKVWDIGYFPNFRGLLYDPTPWKRGKGWPGARLISGKDFIALCIERHILVKDEKAYKELFNAKRHILDTEHLGNFHQQLGYKLRIEERVDADKWWVAQKFTKNLDGLNDTLYKAIQGHFLDTYFKKTFSKKNSVVDLGCGVGLYAKQMAKYAKSVLAIDPTEQFVGSAAKNVPKNAPLVNGVNPDGSPRQ